MIRLTAGKATQQPLLGSLPVQVGHTLGEAAQTAMEHQLPVAVVCRIPDAPRSTIYARRLGAAGQRARPGPATPISDDQLLELVR